MTAWRITNQGIDPIEHFKFNSDSSTWEVVAEDSNRAPFETGDENELRIVAYNVLAAPSFNSWTCDEVRWRYILDVILPNSNADVFLLTEVHETFWRMAKEREWIRRSYYITDYHFKNGPRNNMIISRVPLYNVGRERKNDRRSIVARLGSNDTSVAPFWAVCSHLHAQFNGYLIRKKQLDAMYTYMSEIASKDQAVLIMGDLNFHDESENVNIAEPYFDAYRSLNPVPEDANEEWTEDQKGITFDAERNPFVASIAPGFFHHRMRLDRALIRQAEQIETSQFTHVLKPLSMRVFAKEAISPNTPDLTGSDHYALELVLQKQRA